MAIEILKKYFMWVKFRILDENLFSNYSTDLHFINRQPWSSFQNHGYIASAVHREVVKLRLT